MRLPRFKTMDQKTGYHIRCRVSGPRGWTPFDDAQVCQMIYHFMRKYASIYRCRIVSWEIMPTHFHIVLEFEAYEKLSRRELDRIACLLIRRPFDRPQSRPGYRRLNRRIFDPSEFMRNLDQAIAEWFNRTFDRRGPLFMGRFGSTILADPQALLDCTLYVELNAVRAGLVERPEHWRYGSAWERAHDANPDLMPLTELLCHPDPQRCREEYRYLLYWRGGIAKDGKAAIPEHIVQKELARGFQGGEYLEPMPCFSRGGVLGSFRIVQKWIDSMRNLGLLKRRTHPVPQSHGAFFTVTEQRIQHWALAAAAAGG